MEKIKEYKGIIIVVLVIILGAFYWYSYRPTQIRKECAKYLTGFGAVGFSGENKYDKCLLENGLEK